MAENQNIIRNLLRTLKRNFWVILLSWLTVTATAFYITITAEPQYEASATMAVGRQADLHGELFNLPTSILTKYIVKDQVAILESRSLAETVVERLQESIYADSLNVLGKSASNHSSSILGKWLEAYPGYGKYINHLVEKEPSNDEIPQQKLIENFMSSIKVSFGTESDIVELSATSTNAWEAAYLVNVWINTYQEFNRSDNRGEVTQTKLFLETKLHEMEGKLAIAENKLTGYKKKKNVVSLSEETEQVVAQLTNFESLYNQTNTDLEAVDNELSHLKGQLESSKKTLVEDMVNLSSPILQTLQTQMADLVAQKAAYEAQLLGAGYDSKTDSRLLQMESRLQGVKEKIVEETQKMVKDDITKINPLGHSEKLINQILELETSQRSLSARSTELKKIVDSYSSELRKIPDTSLELARLEREVQVNTKLYMMLKEKYEEMRIKEAGQVSVSRIIDDANVPFDPISPNPPLNMFLACFFGLLLGITIVIAREYMEDSIRDANEIDRMGYRVIGGIPQLKNVKNRRRILKQADQRIFRAKEIFPYLIQTQREESDIDEAYKAIRTSLYFIRQQKRVRSILFTSAAPYEGKSTTVSNLAISISQTGSKVLLVDSDLRRPILDVLFTGSRRQYGLTNYLTGDIHWHQAVRATSHENLYMMPAGENSKNTSELLSSKAMREFIVETKREYDLVLYDSPPMLPVTDPAVLATGIDGVVLVVKERKTSRESVHRSIEILKDVGARLLGTIVTGATPFELFGGYRDYYKTYIKKMAS